jgi:hypothetical protein
MPKKDFQQALGKLVTDPEYRRRVVEDPEQLTKDHPLSVSEIGVLMQVWQASEASDVDFPHNFYCCCCCCGTVSYAPIDKIAAG